MNLQITRQLTVGVTPRIVAQPDRSARRALVRHVAGPAGAVLLATDPTDIDIAGAQGAVTSDAYILPIGNADVFVLAPDQGLYAGVIGGTAVISLEIGPEPEDGWAL